VILGRKAKAFDIFYLRFEIFDLLFGFMGGLPQSKIENLK